MKNLTEELMGLEPLTIRLAVATATIVLLRPRLYRGLKAEVIKVKTKWFPNWSGKTKKSAAFRFDGPKSGPVLS